MSEQDKVLEARRRLAEKFGGNDLKLGGKGTMKRKHKVVHKAGGSDDKKTKDLIKKLGAQPLPEISEINLFTDDNKVIQFKNAEVFGSLQNQTFIVTGNPETKNLKDCFADVLTQLTPAQIEKLKNETLSGIDLKANAQVGKKDDDVPELVNFEDESKK